MTDTCHHLAAIIGAGPAGLFAARELASAGVHVSLFNRDIKPGGLAEYGIYPSKLKMKDGLRAQFAQIMALGHIDYFGNVVIGDNGDMSLPDLANLGYQAYLVTAGAQGTKWLGMPGEDLDGVYHSKDVVYYYNKLPPFSEHELHIGKRVAIIGMGNVMMDLTHYLTSVLKVDEVIAIARRGPGEIKFEKKELEISGPCLDQVDLDQEIDRVSQDMRNMDEDPEAVRTFIHAALDKVDPAATCGSRFLLRFLLSPTRILNDGHGHVAGLEVEHNELVCKEGEVMAAGTGVRSVLDVDTVIFAIGDRVDEHLGLPVKGSEFMKNPNPRYPVEGLSYEVYDPAAAKVMENIFVAGWSRKASTGLVGVARKDGINGARAVLQYLATQPELATIPSAKISEIVHHLPRPVIAKPDLERLTKAERDRARELGLDEFKFSTNQEMLEAMGLLPISVEAGRR